jgi:hypothetical protein
MDAQKALKYRRWIRLRTPLIGPWLRHYAIRKLTQDRSPAAAAALAEIVADANDSSVVSMAIEALENIKEQASIDAVCTAWASSKYSILAEIIVKNIG